MSAELVQALFNELSQVGSRSRAAQALAEHLGAQSLVLYIRDPDLAVMVPAPGMAKTVPSGPRWHAFLKRCLEQDRVTGTVDWPRGLERPAWALVKDGVALILAGGEPDEAALQALPSYMPLLAALLRAEQALLIGTAAAADAQTAAGRAHTLAQALDASRSASSQLNLQLRREHERKDEFLAMLAHELRNPLSPLLNSIEVIRRGGSALNEAGRRQLDVMGRQIGHLTRLVEDLLDVSRVSRGQIELRREVLPLAEVIEGALETSRPLIQSRSHELLLQEAGRDVYVNGDRTRLVQVFANLLNNAAKYTEPGGKIGIRVVVDGGRASVVITDTGAGIPADMLSRIFDLFAQVAASRGQAQGGLGIGLTLVRTLVELHGGHVSAHSVGLGRGSTFTVSLPLVPKR